MNKAKLLTRNVTVHATVQLEVAGEESHAEKDIRDQITAYFAALQDTAQWDHEARSPWIRSVDNLLIEENKNKYQCPKCGNTEAFTERVWEQRQYPVDGAGNSTEASKPVEEPEILIEVSCACCNAIVITHDPEPSEVCDNQFLQGTPHYWEALPPYTDFHQMFRKYLKQFTRLLSTNEVDEFDTILNEYYAASPERRFVMNWLFIRLCGYSLPNIIKEAHGHEPDDESDHQEPNEAR